MEIKINNFYDLEGVTFDIIVLEISNGVFEAKSANAENSCRVEDFDVIL